LGFNPNAEGANVPSNSQAKGPQLKLNLWKAGILFYASPTEQLGFAFSYSKTKEISQVLKTDGALLVLFDA